MLYLFVGRLEIEFIPCLTFSTVFFVLIVLENLNSRTLTNFSVSLRQFNISIIFKFYNSSGMLVRIFLIYAGQRVCAIALLNTVSGC